MRWEGGNEKWVAWDGFYPGTLSQAVRNFQLLFLSVTKSL